MLYRLIIGFILLYISTYAMAASEIRTLKSEIVRIDKDIIEIEAKNNTLADGLVKVLTESRLEVLKMNRSLVNPGGKSFGRVN